MSKASQSDKNSAQVDTARSDKHHAHARTTQHEEQWPPLKPKGDTHDKSVKPGVPHSLRERTNAWADNPIYHEDYPVEERANACANRPMYLAGGKNKPLQAHQASKQPVCTFWLRNRCNRNECQFLHNMHGSANESSYGQDITGTSFGKGQGKGKGLHDLRNVKASQDDKNGEIDKLAADWIARHVYPRRACQ